MFGQTLNLLHACDNKRGHDEVLPGAACKARQTAGGARAGGASRIYKYTVPPAVAWRKAAAIGVPCERTKRLGVRPVSSLTTRDMWA